MCGRSQDGSRKAKNAEKMLIYVAEIDYDPLVTQSAILVPVLDVVWRLRSCGVCNECNREPPPLGQRSQTSSVRQFKFGCDNQLLITTIIPLLFSMPINDGRRPLITHDERNRNII